MDAFFGQDDEDRTDAMTATFNTSASGDPVDKNLALPRVPVTLSNDKAVWYWVCLGVAVATFLVPIGYARWGLLTIAPLKWWQVAASTAAGTPALGFRNRTPSHAPFLPAAITSPRFGTAGPTRRVVPTAGATRSEAKEASACVIVRNKRACR